MAWGANAGYAINPARDFGPRLASFITGYETALHRPVRHRPTVWVPIVAPIIGGLIGGALFQFTHRPLHPRRTRPSPRPWAATCPANENGEPNGRVRRCRRPGHHQHPIHDLRPLRQRGGRATSSSTSRSCRRPAGWSTTPSRSGSAPPRCCRPRSTRPTSPRPTSSRSASPTSARRPSSGTSAPGARSTTRSSGRTPAPTASPRRSTATARATSSGGRPACRPPPTSPAARSSGSWRTSTAPGRPPSAATRSSATPTPGCCGTSPAARDGGVHVTDPTNASRTMLMNLETLDWDDELLGFFGIPRSMLPEIKPSSCPDVLRHHPGERAARRRGPDHRRPR